MRNEESDAIFEVKHRHGNPVISLQCASVIHIAMHENKAPIYKLSHSNTPNYSKFRLTDIRENRCTFLWCRTGVDISSRNNFANLGSFAKVSVPLESIIPYTILLVVPLPF